MPTDLVFRPSPELLQEDCWRAAEYKGETHRCVYLQGREGWRRARQNWAPEMRSLCSRVKSLVLGGQTCPEGQPTSPTASKAEHSWPAHQTLQDQAFWISFVLLGHECSCCELGRPQSVGLAEAGVCKGVARNITLNFPEITSAGKRTGNASLIGSL